MTKYHHIDNVSSYNDKVSSYNDKVSSYNDKIASYNETSRHKAVMVFQKLSEFSIDYASLGEGDLNLLQKKATPFPKVTDMIIAK